MKISKEIGGIFLAIGGILLGSFGLSEGCSNEILAQLAPFIAAAPGLLLAYFGRLSKGDVNFLGKKKLG